MKDLILSSAVSISMDFTLPGVSRSPLRISLHDLISLLFSSCALPVSRLMILLLSRLFQLLSNILLEELIRLELSELSNVSDSLLFVSIEDEICSFSLDMSTSKSEIDKDGFNC